VGFITSNRYGATGYYGEGPYKGQYNDNPNAIRGLSWADTKKCFHLGFTDQQGVGFDEVSGDSWVWPESHAAVLNVFDDSGVMLLVVWDEQTGLPYVISTKDGPANTNNSRIFVDKHNRLVTGSGVDIECTVKLPEHNGDADRFDVSHSETFLHIRPTKATNRGATGYNTQGLPEDFKIDSKIYVDGYAVELSVSNDISTAVENVFPQSDDFSGRTNQQEFIFNKSDFKLVSIESFYERDDSAKYPASE